MWIKKLQLAITAVIVLAVANIILATSHGVEPTNSACLLNVQADNEPLSYRKRDGRCEGIYTRKVAVGQSLTVIGAHLHYPILEENGPITIQINPGSYSDIIFRAVSIRRNHYYQMDTRNFDAQGKFDWSSEVLSKIGLRDDEISAMACVESCNLSSEESIVIPVSIRTQERSVEISPVLIIKPPPQTSELYLTLWEDSSGDVIAEYDHIAFQMGPYDNEVPVSFYLTQPVPPPGLYRFLVEAQLKSGGAEEVRARLLLLDDLSVK